MATLPTFPAFEMDSNTQSLGQHWKRWISKFENFLTALAITNSDRKRALLLHYAGEGVNEVFEVLPNTGTTYNEALTALNTHFTPLQNTEYETYLFRQQKQNLGETLQQFNTRLRRMAANCDFVDIEREIKSQIIIGCVSSKLRKHALQVPTATLTDLLTYGRTNELSEKYSAEMGCISKPTINVMDNKAKYSAWNKSRQQKQHKDKQKNRQCKFCGEQWHKIGLEECKARGKTCSNCGKKNHFARVCLAKQSNKDQKKKTPEQWKQDKTVNVVQNDENDEDASGFVYVLHTVSGNENNFDYNNISACNNVNNNSDQHITIGLNVLGNNITFLIDSGATVDMIHKSDFDRIRPLPVLDKPKINVYAYGSKKPIDIVGTIQVILSHNNITVPTTLFITTEGGPALLGRRTSEALKLIQFLHAIESQPQSSIITKYKKVFSGIGKHKTSLVTLHIDRTVRPIIQKHRRIPFHMRLQVEQELENLEKAGIIEKITRSEPTPWISPIVVVPKKDGIRICIDMRLANLAIQRERHMTPTLDDIVYDLNGAVVFSKLDLAKGYHQLELDIKSRYITTFTTHKGLFRYTRLNFGINAASEIFQNEISKTLQGIEGVMNISDDILVYGKSREQHDRALIEVMERLQETGLTLNKDKCVFNKSHLSFLGYIFSSDGVAPDPYKVEAISKLKAPTTPTEIRSFLGMVNFCTRFLPHLADISQPLRELILKNSVWTWDSKQQHAFDTIKENLTKATTNAYFDNTKRTEVWTDASPIGLGAILIQRNNLDQPQVLSFASRTLTATESRYAQIEREALAVTWAIEHFHIYLQGSRFRVLTDHRPLVTLLGNPRAQLSARLERWKLRLQQYEFDVNFTPGHSNPADYMSRHTVPDKRRTTLEADTEAHINYTAVQATPKAISLEEVKERTLEDKLTQEIIRRVHTGDWNIPKKHKQNEEIQAYRKIRYELSTNKEGSVLLRGSRLILPAKLQQKAINIAHQGHLGITKTKAVIREKTWFRGIDRMVEETIHSCLQCNAVTNVDARAPLKPTPLPVRPWQKVNIDHKGPLPTGEFILVIVDQYSRFPVIEYVTSTSALANIPRLDHIFATFGIPEIVCTDNGPPFSSYEFKQFAETLGFKHRKITPVWPQANGSVERFNRTISKILKISECRQKDWKRQVNQLLMNYRAAPHTTTGSTPFELLFGYKINTQLPEIRNMERPIDFENVQKRDDENKVKAKLYYDANMEQTMRTPQKGDIVMAKQLGKSKMMTPFRMDPYEVTRIKGDMVTASQGDHDITRNQAHFKVLPSKVKALAEERTVEEVGVDKEEIITRRDGSDQLEEQTEGCSLKRNRKPVRRLIEEI